MASEPKKRILFGIGDDAFCGRMRAWLLPHLSVPTPLLLNQQLSCSTQKCPSFVPDLQHCSQQETEEATKSKKPPGDGQGTDVPGRPGALEATSTLLHVCGITESLLSKNSGDNAVRCRLCDQAALFRDALPAQEWERSRKGLPNKALHKPPCW